jgi:Ca2+-binding EF-hand superfamily protein
MGGKPGKYDLIYKENNAIAKLKPQFDLVGLKQADVGVLYQSFLEIDFDNSGCIQLPELLAYVLAEESSFVKRVFSTFDHDESHDINFREFALSTWDYCTLNPKNIGYPSTFSFFDSC